MSNEGLVIGGTKVMLTKLCDRFNATSGEEITYSLVLNNNTPNEITNVIFTDTIPENTTLVSKSIGINSNILPDNNPILASISSVLSGETITLTYKVKINDDICKVQTINNTANLSYKDINNEKHELISNKVITNIKNAIVKVDRFVNKREVCIGDRLVYVVSIVNIGNEKITNVILTEEIPDCVCYVKNSLRLSNEYIHDEDFSSISLGDIKSSEKRLIIYEVDVISMPFDEDIITASKVNYKFTVDPSIPNGVSRDVESNTAITVVNGVKGKYYFRKF